MPKNFFFFLNYIFSSFFRYVLWREILYQKFFKVKQLKVNKEKKTKYDLLLNYYFYF